MERLHGMTVTGTSPEDFAEQGGRVRTSPRRASSIAIPVVDVFGTPQVPEVGGTCGSVHPQAAQMPGDWGAYQQTVDGIQGYELGIAVSFPLHGVTIGRSQRRPSTIRGVSAVRRPPGRRHSQADPSSPVALVRH